LADFRQVVDLCTTLESLCTGVGDARGAALARADRGAACIELGRSHDAVRLIADALRDLEAVGTKTDAIRPQLALAQAEASLGNYARALRAAEAVRLDVDALGVDGELWARANQVYAASLLRMGDFEGAEDVLRRILSEDGRIGSAMRAEAQGDLVQVLAEMGELDDALGQVDDVHRSFQAAGDVRGTFVAETTWSTLLRRRGRPDDALAHARTAKALAAGKPLLERYADFELGASLNALGRSDDANTTLGAVLSRASADGDIDLTVATSIELAELFARTGQAAAALEHAHRALASMTRAIAGLSDDRSAEALTRRGRLFAATIGASRRSNDPGSMFDAIERCRAVGLVCSIGGAKVARATDRTAELEAALQRDVGTEQAASRASMARSNATDATADELLALRRRWHDAVATVDASRERLQREQGLHAATVPTTFTTSAEVRARLAPGQAFASICTLDTEAFALVVEPDREDVRLVDLGPSSALVTRGLLVMQDAIDSEPTATANATATGTWLLDRLALPATVETLVLSVDADLAAVPFSALAFGRAAPLAVAMMPSATVGTALAAYPVVTDRPTLVAAVADYRFAYADTTRRLYLGGAPLVTLSTALAEAKAVAGTTGVLLTDAQATEDAVRARLRDEAGWDAVHVVCHGVIHPRIPALSGLALRPGGTDDGFLDLREVLDLRVRTNLVVLAACQTGLGKVYAGEGIWGLGRAFMLAGAPRVLVSLWKVDDAATTELMAAFHDGRRAGLASAKALRRAQAFVRETPGWQHPRYWAAWQLWGLPD